MKHVGFVTSPLSSGHAVRGVGFYTARLLRELKRQSSKFKIEIVEITDNRQLSTDNLDIVHYPYFDLFWHTLPIFKKTKTIVTIHDVIPLEFPEHYPLGLRGWFNLQLQKLALSEIEGVITVSYHCIKTIHKYLSVPHAKLKLIYEAADPIFRKIPKPKNKFDLPKKFTLYVGDINYNKNIPNLVKACKLTKLPLVIVGRQAAELETLNLSHPELRHLQGLSSQNVRRLGFVSDADLVDIYNLATVYCQPSYAEGFGLPVLEAMACGTAVACSQASSLPEVAGEAAVYFDPYNIQEMASALVKATPKGGQVQAQKFSWARTASQTLDVYQQLI